MHSGACTVCACQEKGSVWKKIEKFTWLGDEDVGKNKQKAKKKKKKKE